MCNSAKRGDEKKKEQVEDIERLCPTLCDIGAQDAIDRIRGNRLLPKKEKESDVNFYLDQRGARIGKMSTQDTAYEKRVVSKRRRIQTEQQRQQAAKEPGASADMPVTAFEDEMGTDEEDEKEDYKAYKTAVKKADTVPVHLPRKILRSRPVCEMADRLRLSASQVSIKSNISVC